MRRLFLSALIGLLSGCAAFNYEDPLGPRYAGGTVFSSGETLEALTVVTFNVRYGEDVEGALAELTAAGLGDADVLLLQEMDAEGTAVIADGLGMAWVYYPASVHGERDFGNAVLSRWPILADEKVLLPGAAPFDGRRRIAVGAIIEGPWGPFFAVSVHNETVIAGEAVQRRQVGALVEHVRRAYAEDLPGIVAGDFNLVGSSQLDRTIARLQDVGLVHLAPENGATTAEGPLGELALDHVFGRGFAYEDARVAPSLGASDHRAVSVALFLR